MAYRAHLISLGLSIATAPVMVPAATSGGTPLFSQVARGDGALGEAKIDVQLDLVRELGSSGHATADAAAHLAILAAPRH